MGKHIAAEDLRYDDVIAILDTTYEYPTFLWSFESLSVPIDEPVRIRWLSQDPGMPLKVKAICLPFVLVMYPSKRVEALDIRQHRFVKLSETYALESWKKFRPKPEKKKKKRKKKKKSVSNK